MKKYAISEKVAKETVDMLQAFIDRIDAECAASGCMCENFDQRRRQTAPASSHAAPK